MHFQIFFIALWISLTIPNDSDIWRKIFKAETHQNLLEIINSLKSRCLVIISIESEVSRRFHVDNIQRTLQFAMKKYRKNNFLMINELVYELQVIFQLSQKKKNSAFTFWFVRSKIYLMNLFIVTKRSTIATICFSEFRYTSWFCL